MVETHNSGESFILLVLYTFMSSVERVSSFHFCLATCGHY
jgi:hypothetical protein